MAEPQDPTPPEQEGAQDEKPSSATPSDGSGGAPNDPLVSDPARREAPGSDRGPVDHFPLSSPSDGESAPLEGEASQKATPARESLERQDVASASQRSARIV